MNPTPYRHAADRIVSRIAVPVLREPVFFCFMLLTFVWPQLTSDLFRIEATHWEILGLYIAYAYAATLPLGILGGKARRWYKRQPTRSPMPFRWPNAFCSSSSVPSSRRRS